MNRTRSLAWHGWLRWAVGCTIVAATLTGCREEPEAPPAAVADGPHLTFDRLVHDFGAVNDLHERQCSFLFTNTGTEPLIIEGIKASCGCTTVELTQHEYAPGTGGSIDVTYTPVGGGVQSKDISIISNSADKPIVELRVNSNVTAMVVYQPRVEFGPVPRGREHVRTVEFSSRDPEMKVTDIAGISPHMTARVVGDDDPRATDFALRHVTGVDIVLNSSVPWGYVSGAFHITVQGKFEGPDVMTHTVQVVVNAHAYDLVRVSESKVLLGQVAPGASAARTIVLTWPEGDNFSLQAMLADPTFDGFTLTADPPLGTSADAHRLTITAHTGDYRGVLRAMLKIRTTVPDDELLQIKVVGTVQTPDPH